MSAPSADFAEGYFMRKLKVEKMKKVEYNRQISSQEKPSIGQNYEGKAASAPASSSSVGCFSKMFNKVHHSSNVTSSNNFSMPRSSRVTTQKHV